MPAHIPTSSADHAAVLLAGLGIQGSIQENHRSQYYSPTFDKLSIDKVDIAV